MTRLVPGIVGGDTTGLMAVEFSTRYCIGPAFKPLR